jgi:alkanesulfonate monooxygenase SsuD/methylene tetrahydromethanopterin reductase-like flavin-dependent oxidoreductase (luciferase family)
VCCNFRNPVDWCVPISRLYAAVLEQIACADPVGFDLVWFTEYPFVEDGCPSSWIAVAAAAAARRKRVRLSSDICLVPFDHRLCLAENVAVLDDLSAGRAESARGSATHPTISAVSAFRSRGASPRRRGPRGAAVLLLYQQESARPAAVFSGFLRDFGATQVLGAAGVFRRDAGRTVVRSGWVIL